MGTGFVLFPHEDEAPPGGAEHHDPLNGSAFTASRQCDVLVYEANTVPPVFRDKDFVILRPEAVRAVIEVKGSLNLPEVRSMLSSFLDFGRKWKATQLFYKLHHQPTATRPVLLGLAWRIAARRDGRPVTSPTRIREVGAEFHHDEVSRQELAALPLLNRLFIYGEYDISQCSWIEGEDFSHGWACSDGRFIRFREDGTAYRNGDRTIADLLADIHYSLDSEGFNRFFSRAGDTRRSDVIPYEYQGYSKWLEESEELRAANTDTV